MIRIVFIAGLLFIGSIIGMIGDSVKAINYSAGTYGTCTYDTCSITLSSTATTNVNITPTSGSALCTVQSNSVTAATDSSTGYTVTINNGDTTAALNGPSGQTISSIGGTAASPSTLTANTWGYRIDTVAGFGTGPTSSVSNASIPVLTFAATPSSASAGGTIRTTSAAEGVGVPTSVWFGVCVDSTKLSGVYTDTVVFTATVN